MAYNPYIVVPLATWAIAQVAKFALTALQGKIDFRYLYASGGMPSVHGAVVSSLATTALLVDGYDSHLFGLSAVLAAIVMYDSLGVRRSTGEQAVALNMLIASMERGKIKLTQPALRLREVLGHKPGEVLVGSLLGVFLAGLFNYDRLGALTDYLLQVPVKTEWLVYAVVFGLFVVLGIVQSFVLRRLRPKSPTMRQMARRIFVASQVTGWIGLVLTYFQYERASYLSWRLWAILILAMGLIWVGWLAWRAVMTLPPALAEEADIERKRRWFTWGRRKKAKK